MFWFFREFLAPYEVVDGNLKVFGEAEKHVNVDPYKIGEIWTVEDACLYNFYIFLPPQNAATEGSPFGRAPALAGERECDHQ